MSKIDVVLHRVRQLPPETQDALAREMEIWLDLEKDEPVLSAEQEAELSRRLANSSRVFVAHEDVVAHFEKKFGR